MTRSSPTGSPFSAVQTVKAYEGPDVPRARASAASAALVLRQRSSARVRLKPDTTYGEVRLKADTTYERARLKPDALRRFDRNGCGNKLVHVLQLIDLPAQTDECVDGGRGQHQRCLIAELFFKLTIRQWNVKVA